MSHQCFDKYWVQKGTRTHTHKHDMLSLQLNSRPRKSQPKSDSKVLVPVSFWRRCVEKLAWLSLRLLFTLLFFFRPDDPDAKENAGNNCMFQKCWSSSLIVSGCALMAAIAWLRLRVLLAMLRFRLEPLLPLASLYSCFKLTPWIATNCDRKFEAACQHALE